MPDIEATLVGTNEVEATLIPEQGIQTQTDIVYLYNPEDISIKHDATLSGRGTTASPLGIEQSLVDKINKAAATFVFDFDASQTLWVIHHYLNKRPSVDVVDSAGSVVEPTVRYIDDNTLEIELNAAFNGTAYLN